jgi:cytidylate kinase
MKNMTIAIDGPAGAGKSTIAKLLAEKLNYVYIDTGAMYRAVTYLYLQSKRTFDEAYISKIAENINLKIKNIAGKNTIWVDNKDISEEIRSASVTANVSRVAAISTVRTFLVEKQRELGKNGNVILDGRDIGTVVFPNADLKIFLTASVEIRAKRRFDELKNKDISYEELKNEIKQRDKFDSERKVSPLCKADDAITIDSSNLDIDQVVDKIFKLVKRSL